MATSTQEVFERNLRNSLIAAQTHHQVQEPDQSHAQPVAGAYQADQPQLHGDGQIDPLIGGANVTQHQSPPSYDLGHLEGIGMAAKDGQQGGQRRELSTTKRAAQNRAAQRAFRQRKEAYITKLEKQVHDYRAMEEDFKALQHENYQLREYILSLQNRLLDSADDLPPPPPRVHLGPPIEHHDEPMDQDAAPTAPMTHAPHPDDITHAAVQQLQAAAAEAGELGDDDVAKPET